MAVPEAADRVELSAIARILASDWNETNDYEADRKAGTWQAPSTSGR
jgi:hypothetical protein